MNLTNEISAIQQQGIINPAEITIDRILPAIRVGENPSLPDSGSIGEIQRPQGRKRRTVCADRIRATLHRPPQHDRRHPLGMDPGHSQNDAMRILMKRLLRNLWRAARDIHEREDQ